MKQFVAVIAALFIAAIARSAIFVGPETPVGGLRYRQTTTLLAPTVAASRDGFLIAWAEHGRVRATMFGRDARRLRMIELGEGSLPSVASDGTNYLIAYNTPGHLLVGIIVSPSGSESSAVTIATSHLSASKAAWTGTGYLIVSYRGGNRSAILSAGGEVLRSDTAIPINVARPRNIGREQSIEEVLVVHNIPGQNAVKCFDEGDNDARIVDSRANISRSPSLLIRKR